MVMYIYFIRVKGLYHDSMDSKSKLKNSSEHDKQRLVKRHILSRGRQEPVFISRDGLSSDIFLPSDDTTMFFVNGLEQ